MFTAFPLFSPPLKIIFIFHRSESNQLNPSPERPFLKEKKLLFQFQIFNQTKPLTLRANFRVFTKKKIPSLVGGSNSTTLNCADTEVALGYTGKERRTRHSTAAYTSFLPSCRLYQTQSLCTATGIPGRGKEYQSLLDFFQYHRKK